MEKEIARENEAIENILNELERLQKKNERLIERNIKYDETLEKLQKETIWKFKIQNKIEELNKDIIKMKKAKDRNEYITIKEIVWDKTISILKELLGE